MIWFAWVACFGESPTIPLSDGGYFFEPGTVPAPADTPPSLKISITGEQVTFRIEGSDILIAQLGEERVINGCPRNMSSDRLVGRVVEGTLPLGTLALERPLLVPGCQGDAAIYVTADGHTAGPCPGEPCIRFSRAP